MGFQVFDKDLKAGLKPVYLFYGEEKYLMEQYLQNVIEMYVEKGQEDFNLHHFDGEQATVAEIIDACETLPFFATHKVVIVKNAPYFRSKKSDLTEASSERLLNYISTPSHETYLFFMVNEAIDKRKKVTKAIETKGRIVEFGKLDANIFGRWVHKKIKKQGVDLEHQVLNYLVARLAYLGKDYHKSLLEVENEIQILCSSVYNKKIIEIQDVDALIKKPLEADMFKLVDAVGKKNASQGILMMHELLSTGEAIQGIFHMICRQFRLLKKIQMLVKEGYPQQTIAKTLGLHPYVVKLTVSQIHLFTSDQLSKILVACSDIDYKMKSTNIEPVLAVEQLMINCSLLE